MRKNMLLIKLVNHSRSIIKDNLLSLADNYPQEYDKKMTKSRYIVTKPVMFLKVDGLK